MLRDHRWPVILLESEADALIALRDELQHAGPPQIDSIDNDDASHKDIYTRSRNYRILRR